MDEIEAARKELTDIAKRSSEMDEAWIIFQVQKVRIKYPSVDLSSLYSEIIRSL